MNLENYEKAIDKTINTVNSAYSIGRRIGYVLMGLVFLLAGIGLTAWGYLNIKNKIEGTNFVKTEGVVLRMREVPETQENGITYAPVIKFTDRAGNEHTFESTVSSDPPAYKVGEKVELLYPEGKPDDVFINSFMEKWLTPILLGIGGIVMFGFAIWLLVSGFRREKTSQETPVDPGNSASYISIG